jgi:hypothetical protein
VILGEAANSAASWNTQTTVSAVHKLLARFETSTRANSAR